MEGKLFCDTLLDNNHADVKNKSHNNDSNSKNHRHSILEKEKSLGVEKLIEAVKSEILAASKCSFPTGIKPRTDTAFILKFLRVKNYCVEATVKRIIAYYNHVHRNLRIVEGIRIVDYTKVYENQVVSVLKSRMTTENNNSLIVYVRCGKWNPQQISFQDLQLAALFLLEELMRDDEVNQCNGVSVITDLGGIGFSHIRQLSAMEVKRTIQIFMSGLPVKVHGIHMINVPRLFWPVYSVVSKVLPDKIRERIHIYKEHSCLHEVISAECLPESLGGHLEETEGLDETIIASLTRNNPVFDSYWSGEINRRPRRLSRKRSSLLLG